MAHALHVVATVRSAEPAPDAVVALWKDGWLECLNVQPLDRVALGELVAGLVAGLVGGRVDSLAVARVWEQTRGNALFCRELVRASVAGGGPLTLRLSLRAGGLTRTAVLGVLRAAATP